MEWIKFYLSSMKTEYIRMKKYTLFAILLLFLAPMISRAQLTLTIEIKGLRNNTGQILLQVFDEGHTLVKGVIGSITDKKCTILIENLKPSKYAFRYFHDENKNGELEKNWQGIPREGYGFSNNAKGTFGPPSFGKWIFELKDNETVICNPIY
jgi:uncharacterized protein (DUF2141 family)